VEVGVGELRNNLSRYLGRVRDGEKLVVTDRGRAIAQILPIGAERTPDRLIADGMVTPAKVRKRRAGARVKPTGTVSDVVTEQRG
jgi:prevent-host-death family protein